MMFDIVIVGAGPAGISAALFTAKADKHTLVVDNVNSLTQHAWVRNYYGIEKVDGSKINNIGKEQAKNFGAVFVKATVTNIEKWESGFKIFTSQGQFEAQRVLLATGASNDLAEKIGLVTKSVEGIEGSEVSEIVVVDSAGHTSIDGIWAAGVIAGASSHVLITAGDGAKIAVNMISEINGQPYIDHDGYDS